MRGMGVVGSTKEGTNILAGNMQLMSENNITVDMNVSKTKPKEERRRWKKLQLIGSLFDLVSFFLCFIFSTFSFISLLDSTNIQDKIHRLSQRGSSYLLVAKDGNLEGMVVLIDSIRPDAAEAIQLLNKVSF